MADETIPEEWRIVVNYPDYEVSNLGRVRRATDYWGPLRQGGICLRYPAGRPVRPNPGSHAYPRVNLYNGDRKKMTIAVCVLVCRAFHGNAPSPKHEVAHWDGDRANSMASNLRWATHKENAQDTIRHGRTPRGNRHGQIRLTEDQVREIKHRISIGETQASLARAFSVSYGTIANIKLGYAWSWLK